MRKSLETLEYLQQVDQTQGSFFSSLSPLFLLAGSLGQPKGRRSWGGTAPMEEGSATSWRGGAAPTAGGEGQRQGLEGWRLGQGKMAAWGKERGGGGEKISAKGGGKVGGAARVRRHLPPWATRFRPNKAPLAWAGSPRPQNFSKNCISMKFPFRIIFSLIEFQGITAVFLALLT